MNIHALNICYVIGDGDLAISGGESEAERIWFTVK